MNVSDLDSHPLYVNRELSLLSFFQRVLAESENPANPLLERLRFLFIVSSNLDEFFEIRVAGLKEKVLLGHTKPDNDGLSPQKALSEISRVAHAIVLDVYRLLNQQLIPELASQNILLIPMRQWDSSIENWIRNYFRNEVLPVLSPIGLDYAHPFPRLVNKSLNFIVSLEGKDAFGRDSGLAIVHAPRALPRTIKLPAQLSKNTDKFVFLTDAIAAHAQELFPGMTVTGCYQFRLTRNSDLYLENDPAEDLAKSLKQKLLSRQYGSVARLEIAKDCPLKIVNFLLQKHGLSDQDVYYCDGPVNLNRYMSILGQINRPDLLFSSFTPSIPRELEDKHNIFNAIATSDVLLHHPYESFAPVINLIRQATLDPNVIAIKQTLYRTAPESALVKALGDAARAGKEVTVIIEIRARFDEESNISLANYLQDAGALVVYGVIGFKTHAKMCLVVRREHGKLCRYAHLGTGNYHEGNTKSYTDYGLMTFDRDLTSDVQKVFQLLTGLGRSFKMKKLLYSPFTLFKSLIESIDREISIARSGRPARIIIKVNGLTDRQIIKAFYRASQAGVKIDLIVRGVCCLRPGIKTVSDNIRVVSVVGRFLEHSRIYYFLNNGNENLYCASADLMERNLHHRVEVAFPIEDPRLINRIKQESLFAYLDDSKQAWCMHADGSYSRKKNRKVKTLSAQEFVLSQFDKPNSEN